MVSLLISKQLVQGFFQDPSLFKTKIQRRIIVSVFDESDGLPCYLYSFIQLAVESATLRTDAFCQIEDFQTVALVYIIARKLRTYLSYKV